MHEILDLWGPGRTSTRVTEKSKFYFFFETRLFDLRPARWHTRGAMATTASAAGGSAPGSKPLSAEKKALVRAPPRRARGKRGPRRRVRYTQRIPAEILDDPALRQAMAVLPKNYNFEIPKTVWRLRSAGSRRVALQFPEGLLMYACIISDILGRFAGVETLIMGDVTYGACCVDDLSARALGCDFLVHYGHSCLVPVDSAASNQEGGKGLRMLYVFVEIGIDVKHLVSSLSASFDKNAPLILAGTIQFAAALRGAKKRLTGVFKNMEIPQAKPLSPGEVLGCTAPRLGGISAPSESKSRVTDGADACKKQGSGQDGTCGCRGDAQSEPSVAKLAGSSERKQGGATTVVFVADGRFHLESLMIHNPEILNFYKYDPYSRKLTEERYDHDRMLKLRRAAVDAATKAQTWGVIMGTLGRQGNPGIVNRLRRRIEASGRRVVVVLLSEIFPSKLAQFPNVGAWVQVACPRLSIDWGHAFKKPLLSPYEAEVALGGEKWRPVYPMDFYAKNGGPWSNYHPETTRRRAKKTGPQRPGPVRRKKAHVEIGYDDKKKMADASSK